MPAQPWATSAGGSWGLWTIPQKQSPISPMVRTVSTCNVRHAPSIGTSIACPSAEPSASSAAKTPTAHNSQQRARAAVPIEPLVRRRRCVHRSTKARSSHGGLHTAGGSPTAQRSATTGALLQMECAVTTSSLGERYGASLIWNASWSVSTACNAVGPVELHRHWRRAA